LELFLSLLGSVAGNLALTLGALGGVYIGGGIVPRLDARIDASRLRQRFEQKGRFAGYLSRIPVKLILPGGEPALRGAARALDT
jgi:glucokinase